MGLYDPPRETIPDAIAACQDVGIGVVIVTGDQPATAANIAHAIGITENRQPEVLRGRDLGRVGDAGADRLAEILDTSVFARVSPDQKLSLVSVYQEDGAIVGMTDGGVNDAPALKKTDIDIAMGQRGTKVAREKSCWRGMGTFLRRQVLIAQLAETRRTDHADITIDEKCGRHGPGRGLGSA